MASFPIVGVRRTPEEFRQHVNDLALVAFQPQFVVVHNTSQPTLAQRPNGFSTQNMHDLVDFYANTMHFSGGPHLFIDDKGIWEFNPLNRRGTHSPSWNDISWGVEMLGEYEDESFTSGRGALVAENAVQAVAILCNKLQVSTSTIRFHKQDPLTAHTTCPGHHVVKADFLHRVEAAMNTANAFDIFVNGTKIGTALEPFEKPGHTYTPARPLFNALFGRDAVSARIGFNNANPPQLLWDQEIVPADVLLRAPGVAWVAVRDIVDWQHLGCEVNNDPNQILLTTP